LLSHPDSWGDPARIAGKLPAGRHRDTTLHHGTGWVVGDTRLPLQVTRDAMGCHGMLNPWSAEDPLWPEARDQTEGVPRAGKAGWPAQRAVARPAGRAAPLRLMVHDEQARGPSGTSEAGSVGTRLFTLTLAKPCWRAQRVLSGPSSRNSTTSGSPLRGVVVPSQPGVRPYQFTPGARRPCPWAPCSRARR